MTDWYRRSTEELRAKQEYVEERDRVLKPRVDQPAPAAAPVTIPKPWEGLTEIAQAMGINLGQMSKDREQELKDAREAQGGMEKELHELRVREIDHRVEELQKLMEEAQAKVQSSDGKLPTRHARMEDAIETLIANRLEKLLGGNEQPQLTKEDIQRVALEAVNASKNGPNSPQQMMDTFMSFISAADTAKKKMIELGGGQVGDGGNPYLTQAGSLRSDVLRILLENDLAKIKLQQDYDIAQERTKHLGALAGTVKNNIEDIVAASRDMVKDHRDTKGRPKQEPGGEQGGFAVRCSECSQISTYPEMPSGTFACLNCGAQLKLQEASQPPPPPPPGERPKLPPVRPMTGLEF